MSKSSKDRCSKKPAYKKELSIFSKDVIKKIEEFRIARSKWIESQDLRKTMNKYVTEDLYDPYIYKGRCICLRKIGFKTNRIRSHYRTLRPLKCYTLKRKLTDPEIVEKKDKESSSGAFLQKVYFQKVESEHKSESKESIKIQSVYSVMVENSKKLHKPIKTTLWFKKIRKHRKSKILNKNKENRIVASTIDNCVNRVSEIHLSEKFELNEKGKQKIYFNKNKWLFKKEPNKHAMENLKSKKKITKVIKPCTCETGKEVTLIIKGFCLCEKLNLNKLNPRKLCDKYCKSQIEKVVREPSLTDSLELYRKKFFSNDIPKEKDLPEISPDSKTTLFKTVSFKKQKHTIDNKHEPLLKKTDSMVILFKNKKSEKSEMSLTKEQFDKIKSQIK